jgi:hypothetical protein
MTNEPYSHVRGVPSEREPRVHGGGREVLPLCCFLLLSDCSVVVHLQEKGLLVMRKWRVIEKQTQVLDGGR